MSNKPDKKEDRKSAVNRRATHRYEIIDSLEAGIVLKGSEVKSMRAGGVNLVDGFARIEDGQAYLWNVHIAPYAMGSRFEDIEPTRKRKLLLKKREIIKLGGKTTIKGLTLVPLEMYFNARGIAKVKLGLARGKNAPDKRDDIKKRDIKREMQREFSGRRGRR
jgi:SsrA-binding protein